MNRWQDPSSLARAPLARTAEALDAAWGRAAVVEADAGGNFTGRGGHPVPLSDPGPRRPEDILVGEADGRAWFVRLVPEVAVGLSWRTGDPAQGDVLAAVVALARRYALRMIGMSKGLVIYDGPPAGLQDSHLAEIYGGEGWME